MPSQPTTVLSVSFPGDIPPPVSRFPRHRFRLLPCARRTAWRCTLAEPVAVSRVTPTNCAPTPPSPWRWPVVLGLLTASGLVSALVSEGWGDVWSWLALGLPVFTIAWCVWRPTRRTAAPADSSLPPP